MATLAPEFAAQSQPRSADMRPLVLHARVVTGAGGGPEKTILNSPKYLVDHGYDCQCLYLRPPGDERFRVIHERAERYGAPLVVIDDRGPWDLRIVRRTLDLCRKERVAIWHGHDYKSNLLGLLLRRWHPMRLVTTVHGWVHKTKRTGLYYALDRWSLRRYERVICVSPDLADECRQVGVDPDNVRQIDNAIDTTEFARRRSVAEAKVLLEWPANRLLIGAVGRLAAEKGFDLLIRAVAKLVVAGRDVGLAIAGHGPEHDPLVQLANDLGVADRVRLLGFVSDTIGFYEAMDLYALSSHREGLPNVLLEAMAIGVPIVSTDVAGIPALVDNGSSGLLIAPGNLDQLIDALAQLIDRPDLRRRFADEGRATVVERFDFSKRMAKIVAIYDELLNRPATQGPDAR